ncbi:amino acid adenylation domain-containing protein [Paraburkholderia sp. J63]|uniref:non-ribosomal peptide synthetase n=1 Tax=Paraburkholderia sp. J63 TaxID=2805434 RepID=UPI002ABD7AA6|nr:amino acid adenylation domain-containing protein [Paraburkholderia sp. J63]
MNDFSPIAAQSGYPLSQQQRAALADAALANQPVLFAASLDGACDPARLRAAFAGTVAAHEILRTAFVAVEGYSGLRQHPMRHGCAEWHTVDAHGLESAEAIALVLERERAVPFEPGAGRTLRAVLVSLAPARAVLVWIASRLVADADSLARLHDALLDAYAAPRGAQADDGECEEEEEDEGVLDYGQYVEWREELAQSDDAHTGRAYWSAQTAADPDLPAIDALPYRRTPRVASADVSAGASPSQVQRAISTDGAVGRLAARLGTTPDVIAQAAWWVLIGRIADAARVAGHWQNDCRRDYAELAGAIGPFDAVLPLSLDVRPERTFRAVAGALAATLDAHREVQEYWASPAPASRAHGGIGFRFGAASASRRVDAALASAPLMHSFAAASFDLALDVQADAQGEPVVCTIHHAPGHYAEVAAQTLLDQYATLLAALIDAPATIDAPLASLVVVGDAERARLLDCRGPVLDIGARPIPERVSDFAASQPAAQALVAADLTLDYAQLERHVAAAAHRLTALGASRERPVAIALPRSGGLVVALLAAMRAGAPYLPLDPQWPPERRQRIVDAAQPAITIVDDTDEGALASAGAMGSTGSTGAIGIAELLASPAAPAEAAPACSLDSPAYLLFTSGSTGIPKGVLIGQRQLLNYALAVTAELGLDASQRYALTSTVAADLGNTTLFGALARGGCLIVATADDMRDGEAFARFVRRHEIGCVKIVPSHLDALLEAREPALPPLVVLGGEAASAGLLARIAQVAPATRIVNHYGPTETTVGVAVHEYSANSAAAGRYASGLPLTAPLANCRLRVLDRFQELTPIGATGELYIGGAQLCDGYWGATGMEAFIDDPFMPGERLYRSGDLARVEPDGGIRIVGRADDQVKVRGFRIEPGEVEAALGRLPQVRQAAVRALRRAGEHELVGYVVPADATVSPASLKAALRTQVPDAMVPARFVVLARLPRLPNGKIDHQALPDPADDAAAVTRRAPADALETLLANTAAELLERPAIGVDDDFFDLGGHSLLVIRFVTRLQELLRTDLLPGDVFEHPTVAALARTLRERDADPAKLEKVAALRLKLAAMSPEAREAMLAMSRQGRPE